MGTFITTGDSLVIDTESRAVQVALPSGVPHRTGNQATLLIELTMAKNAAASPESQASNPLRRGRFGA